MKRFRRIVDNTGVSTFGNLRVGQSFTVDGEVWLAVGPTAVGNAVRISAQAEAGSPRYATFGRNDEVFNANMYHLVHESRLGELS